MRKIGFLEEAWLEYTQAVKKIIPESISSRIFTRKFAYVAVVVVLFEVLFIASIYWLWFRNS